KHAPRSQQFVQVVVAAGRLVVLLGLRIDAVLAAHAGDAPDEGGIQILCFAELGRVRAWERAEGKGAQSRIASNESQAVVREALRSIPIFIVFLPSRESELELMVPFLPGNGIRQSEVGIEIGDR